MSDVFLLLMMMMRKMRNTLKSIIKKLILTNYYHNSSTHTNIHILFNLIEVQIPRPSLAYKDMTTLHFMLSVLVLLLLP